MPSSEQTPITVRPERSDAWETDRVSGLCLAGRQRLSRQTRANQAAR